MNIINLHRFLISRRLSSYHIYCRLFYYLNTMNPVLLFCCLGKSFSTLFCYEQSRYSILNNNFIEESKRKNSTKSIPSMKNVILMMIELCWFIFNNFSFFQLVSHPSNLFTTSIRVLLTVKMIVNVNLSFASGDKKVIKTIS
jgi:hypothetical protein